VRVLLSTPSVKLPAGHTVHVPAPAALYMLSLPQSVHACWPPTACVPASHCVSVLPLHLWPSLHAPHLPRVVPSALPPEVALPAGH